MKNGAVSLRIRNIQTVQYCNLIMKKAMLLTALVVVKSIALLYILFNEKP